MVTNASVITLTTENLKTMGTSWYHIFPNHATGIEKTIAQALSLWLH
jgi:hypothetical protein